MHATRMAVVVDRRCALDVAQLTQLLPVAPARGSVYSSSIPSKPVSHYISLLPSYPTTLYCLELWIFAYSTSYVATWNTELDNCSINEDYP
jgi:hypothetical protein